MKTKVSVQQSGKIGRQDKSRKSEFTTNGVIQVADTGMALLHRSSDSR
ncbi:hypothetical protein [Wolbachia endosymbiont of Oedothorax gibbosus]|nr:hypothetical protein [Wolbachia endosymbiont of Oedothorax gibbosus]